MSERAGEFNISIHPKIKIPESNNGISINIPRMTNLIEEIFYGQRRPDRPVELDLIIHNLNILPGLLGYDSSNPTYKFWIKLSTVSATDLEEYIKDRGNTTCYSVKSLVVSALFMHEWKHLDLMLNNLCPQWNLHIFLDNCKKQCNLITCLADGPDYCLAYDAIEEICERPVIKEIENILAGKLEPLIMVGF